MPALPLHGGGTDTSRSQAQDCRARRFCIASNRRRLCGRETEPVNRQNPTRRSSTLLSAITRSAAEAEGRGTLDDLEAIAVELRLMQPIIASRNGLGDRGDAGTDELRSGHPQDEPARPSARKKGGATGHLVIMVPRPLCQPGAGSGWLRGKRL